MQRLDRSLIATLPGILCSLLCFLVLSPNLRAQNGVSAKEGATITTLTSLNDYLWADSSALRWMVSLSGNSAQPLMVWPCTAVGQVGGIVYSGAAPIGSSINTESCLPLPATIDPGVPLLVGPVASSAPQWGATYLNLQANPLVTEFANP